MPGRRIPTYAEIASFRESLIKTRKQLELDELEKLHGTLVRMEFDCLRGNPVAQPPLRPGPHGTARERARLNTASSTPTNSSGAGSKWLEVAGSEASAGLKRPPGLLGRSPPSLAPPPHPIHDKTTPEVAGKLPAASGVVLAAQPRRTVFESARVRLRVRRDAWRAGFRAFPALW